MDEGGAGANADAEPKAAATNASQAAVSDRLTIARSLSSCCSNVRNASHLLDVRVCERGSLRSSFLPY